MPRASVVVLTRNRADSLRRTLAALARLDHPSYEVIVVDNGSTDDTAEAAREAGVRYLRTPAETGIAGSRQAGAEAARGAVVAYTDDDCIPVPGWLAALERRLLAEPELGLVGGRVDNVGFTGRRQFKGRTRLAVNGTTEFVEDPRDADFFGNANLAFRKPTLEEIGGYDPFFTSGRAELDLAMRIRRAGYRVGYEPEAAVEHRHDEVSLRHGRLFRGHQLMRLYFFLKNLRPRGLREWLGFAGRELRLAALDLRRAVRAMAAGLVRGRPERLRWGAVELFNLFSARLAAPWLLWRARALPSRLRIAYLAVSIVPSRTANSVHVMKMCQAYARLGHRVTLWVPAWRREIERGVRDVHAFYGVEPSFAVRRVPVPPKPFHLPFFAVLLPLLAAAGRPHLMHSRGLAAAWGSARLMRRPTLFETHAPPPENPRRRRLFDGLVGSRSLRRVAVISAALAERVDLYLPAGARPSLVAPDGVDAAWIDDAPDREAARKRLDLEEERRRIAVYTGHLYEGRGIERILEIARLRGDHLFLVIGGRDSDLERWRERVGNPDNVRFAGFRPPAEMPLWLAAADVLLMPYADRVAASGGGDVAPWISPMKMFEYLAAGRPILASTLPVLSEVLEHEGNALLLPYDEPERWSEALVRLASDPDLAGRLSERARADARRYTWEERACRLLSICGLPVAVPAVKAVVSPLMRAHESTSTL